MSAISHDLEQLYSSLETIEGMEHIIKILNYDMETAAPKGGMEDDAKNVSVLSNDIFKMKKDSQFMLVIHKLYTQNFSDLDNWEKRLITLLQRDLDRNKGISPKLDQEANELFSKAYMVWLNAKEANSYAKFQDTLEQIAGMEKKLIDARMVTKGNYYDTLLSDFEYGFTTQDLDAFFSELEQGIVPLYQAVRKASYSPRHDFLNRPVPIKKQEEFSRYLLEFNGFDFDRGSISTTEHPFTEQFGKDDVRVTTKYFETNFISNMYSVIHEGGHALFGQNIPEEVFEDHIGEGSLSMAKHESVSRFYENIVGRSKEYIHAIYPAFHKLFEQELGDISESDLYEGVNYIDPNNLLRTEADELSYTLHIIIRYQLEKAIMNGEVDFATLNQKWNDLYKEYFDVEVKDDKDGILQDVHWSSGFGYFPTYAMGNAMNCMYVKKMDEEIGFAKTVKSGKMKVVLDWMRKNVFASAPLYDTKDWIKKITGKPFAATDYIEYLTNKFSKLYHLTKTDIKNATKEFADKKKGE